MINQRIAKLDMTRAVFSSGRQIWVATDVLKACGVRSNANSKHRDYRRALTTLRMLEKQGMFHSRHFPEVNLTVFVRIP